MQDQSNPHNKENKRKQAVVTLFDSILALMVTGD